MKICVTSALVAVSGLAVVTAGSAQAALIGNAFTLSATNGSGTDGVTIPNASLVYDGGDNSYSYAYTGPSFTLSNGVVVESFDVYYPLTNPGVSMTFVGHTAGQATTFSLSTATHTFGPLIGQFANASAGMTLTGINASNANMVGLNAGFAHLASFNTGPYYVNVASFGVANANGTADDFGFTGPDFIAGPVSSLVDTWSFTVDADDSVSINSFASITPAPGTLGLLGLGGLVIARRRR